MEKITHRHFQWLDYMKGFAIFLVVMGHVCPRESALGISAFIYVFHMPFFMMLSGLLAHKYIDLSFLSLLEKKSKSLIIPFISFGILISITMNAWEGYIYSVYHAGYWFLYSLFWCWLIWGMVRVMMKHIDSIVPFRRKLILFRWLIEILIYTLPYIISKLIVPNIDTEIDNMLSISWTMNNYRFFILGYYVGIIIFKYDFLNNVRSPIFHILTFSIFSILASLYLFGLDKLIPTTIYQIALCLTLFLYFISKSSNYDSLFQRTILYWGKNTLLIYVLHYYLLTLLDRMNLFTNNEGLNVIMAVLVSIIIVMITLLLARPFKKIRVMSYLFLGKV